LNIRKTCAVNGEGTPHRHECEGCILNGNGNNQRRIEDLKAEAYLSPLEFAEYMGQTLRKIQGKNKKGGE